MKQTDNKEDFFSQLKDTFYPGDMLFPVSFIISNTNWMINKFYTGKEDISEKEIEKWIHRNFGVLTFNNTECIRTFRRDIPAGDCEQSSTQIGICIPLCSFEIAVMLRKLEYNESCSVIYKKVAPNRIYVMDHITDYPITEPTGSYPAADLLAVQDWLRQKYNIIVEVSYTYEGMFVYIINSIKEKPVLVSYSSGAGSIKYDTSYYALNAGILEALSNILKSK